MQNTSIRFEIVWINFIDFMLKGKDWQPYTNFFSPNDYENKDKTILKCFQLLKDEKIVLRYLQ